LTEVFGRDGGGHGVAARVPPAPKLGPGRGHDTPFATRFLRGYARLVAVAAEISHHSTTRRPIVALVSLDLYRKAPNRRVRRVFQKFIYSAGLALLGHIQDTSQVRLPEKLFKSIDALDDSTPILPSIWVMLRQVVRCDR